MEQIYLNQCQSKVQFEPYLSFSQQSYSHNQQATSNQNNLFSRIIRSEKQKTIYIGLLDIKQQNLKLLFKNYDITKRINKSQPTLYISQQIRLSYNTPIKYIYLSNQKNDSPHHALLASILTIFSSSIVYEFNSKYVRSSKSSQSRQILLKQLGYQNTKPNQFVLISQKEKQYVYKISMTQNNRMEIKQKFAFPTDILKQSIQNNCQKAKKLQINSLKEIFQFYWIKQTYLFEEKHSQFLGQLILLTYSLFIRLQKQEKFCQYLIKKKTCQQDQQDNVFFTFQNFQCLKKNLKQFAENTNKINLNLKQKISETLFKIIQQQIQQFKQKSLIKILQNLQNQHFCVRVSSEQLQKEDQNTINYLLESEQLKIKEEQIIKKLASQNIKPEFSQLVTHKYQATLMKKYIQILQTKISQQEQLIQNKQIKLVQKSIKINFQQSQLEEQSKRNFLLKQISQQLQIMQQKLDQANLDKRKLKMDIEAYLNQIKQFKQREVRLQGIINAYRQEKNNMLQAIGKLTKENLQYLCQIKQKNQTIQELLQKNSHYQHIERVIIKEKQKNMILQQNLNEFKKYHQQIEKNWSCFKERQLAKFNFILSQNWTQYQKQLKKTQHLQAKIEEIESKYINQQKEKKMMQIQVQYFQKVFYEKICGSKSETNINSRQQAFYQMSNIHKMQDIFQSIQEDFTTDRIKQNQGKFDKKKSIQNQHQQLRISNY